MFLSQFKCSEIKDCFNILDISVPSSLKRNKTLLHLKANKKHSNSIITQSIVTLSPDLTCRSLLVVLVSAESRMQA